MLNEGPKVAVYMICKNGAKEIYRCFQSVIEQRPDSFIIVDTGSTDETTTLLKEWKLQLERPETLTLLEAYISPWRFDDARNLALAAVPADIDLCISIDADELLAPGFIDSIKHTWNSLDPKPTRINHSFETIWDWEGEQKNVSKHFHERVHARFGYRWVHPVHEKLVCSTYETLAWCKPALMIQKPDMSKDRTSYLPLLHQAVKEDPTDWKLWAFLAAELGSQQQAYTQARTAYETALTQPNADKSWLFLQLAMLAERHDEVQLAKSYMLSAIAENPTRELLMHKAELCERQGDIKSAQRYYAQALEVIIETQGYMRREDAWNGNLEARLTKESTCA